MKHYKNTSLENLTEYVDGVTYVERWADIEGFEGCYMVSDFGRVKSVGRVITTKKGIQFPVKEKIRVQVLDKDRYLCVTFSINQFKTTHKVHRLVAFCFIENVNLLPEINHRFFIKDDNRFHQLEWVTPKQNTTHSFENQDRKIWMRGRSGGLHHNAKKVYCPTLGLEFGSAAEAQRELGLIGVGEVCNGNLVHAKGLSFRYILN